MKIFFIIMLCIMLLVAIIGFILFYQDCKYFDEQNKIDDDITGY